MGNHCYEQFESNTVFSKLCTKVYDGIILLHKFYRNCFGEDALVDDCQSA